MVDAIPQKVQVVLYGVTSQKLQAVMCVDLKLPGLMLLSSQLPMWAAGITAVSQSPLSNDGGGFGNTKNEHI